MGRKKITNLFPDYIRTGKADLEMLSQLVLRAKGSRSMNDFANECEVNTSTISRIINMKNTPVPLLYLDTTNSSIQQLL